MRCSYLIGWLTAILFAGSALLAYGQPTASLTGSVIDATTEKPMPFANVYINGSTRGAVTDEKGVYTLTGILPGTVEVVASFVGYQAASHLVRLENASPKKVNFRLKPSEQTLDAVTVKGNPKNWERQLRQFKKLLFGEPFGGQCVLANSEVLQFREDKGHLYATATAPLRIDNQALGYRLLYDLHHFDGTAAGEVYYGGTARFEEIAPGDERQRNRFQRNRLTAYKGSIRHLMASLTDNTFKEAGFLVYQEDGTKMISLEQRSITLSAAVNDLKRLLPVQPSALIQPGRLSTERRLVSPMKLIVFYTPASSGFSPYPDARYAYTEMRLPKGQLQMTVDGVITMPEGMEVQGSMSNDRLSTMLPADWKPEPSEKSPLASESLSTQGKILPPDTRMNQLTVAFNERFRLQAPTVFAHIDKPFYATGDRLWMSMYVLDAASHQRTGHETAVHVDLLSSSGRLVQHQWIRIAGGRGEGTFRLSDTLATGTYRLRAYTDDDEAQRRPAFERSVAIYNLFRPDLSTRTDSVPQQADIQILPEGGRWILGLPARLGIKIVQPNGHGLPITGRIIDDLGAEAVRFKTNPQGMTSISLVPRPQRTYYADVLYNNQPQRVPLPQPATEGLLLAADVISDTTHLALTIQSANRAASDTAYVLVQQRGHVVDERKIRLHNGEATIRLPMKAWLPGLAQITLYDASARPQAERLVFVPEFTAPVRVLMAFHKKRYQPREQAVLSLNLSNNGSPVQAALSASVTDAGQVPDDTADASLPVHVLLTGELRGRVEHPNQYVLNHSAETRRALDDLLLTQGWRRVSGTSETDSLGGVSLRGRILTSRNTPIPGARITVLSTGPRQSFVKSADADEQGRFRLAGLAIADSVLLMAKITDRKLTTLLAKDARLIQETPGIHWESSTRVDIPNGQVMRAQLEAARIRQEANTDVYRDKTAKELSAVTVRAQKFDKRPEDIQQRSLHNEADAVIIVDDKSPSYQNLYEMIQGRLTGVTVKREGAAVARSYQVSIRGTTSFTMGSQPLYLMDGMPIDDTDGRALFFFSPSDIERIELLKSAITTGTYGARGGNGVIAFYTKRTRSMQGNANISEGMRPIPFIGYPSVQREFYVPRYDTEAIPNSPSTPIDSRDVLYWKPLMQTDSQGHSQLRFPLSDVVRTLRVVIQGVTADGHPVQGVQLIRVQ